MVSIGLPIYNAEEHIIDTLKSIFSQSYDDWELIIVDDGSSDRSLDIVQSINDPRVSVYSDGENKKLANRLNQITALANRKYLLRLDSGDMCATNRIERLLSQFDKDTKIVSSDLGIIDSNSRYCNTRRNAANNLDVKSIIKFGSPIAHATIMLDTEWAKKNKYNASFHRTEDLELWTRSVKSGSLRSEMFKKLDEPLYYYRDDSNVSIKQLKTSFKERNLILDIYGKDILNNTEIISLKCKRKVKLELLKLLSTTGLYGKFKIAMLSNNLTNDQDRVDTDLNKINETKIPGVD